MNNKITGALATCDSTPVILVGRKQDEFTITSVDLTSIINQFRSEEGNQTVKLHNTLMRDIRNEIEVLKNAGIGQNNFVQSSYMNLQNKEQPCYLMNKAGVLQMLNKESAVVRYKTVEYIEKLEKDQHKESYRIDDPIERAKAWIIEQQEKQALQLENKQQQQIIGELKPKATYYDLVLQSKDLMTITMIAKDYGMSGQALNDRLHDLGVQYKQSGVWFLYAEHQGLGYTQSKTQSYNKPDGSTGTKLHTQWTQKGRLFLYDLLKQNGILPVMERSNADE